MEQPRCYLCKHYQVVDIDENDDGMIDIYGCNNDESFYYRSPMYRDDVCDTFESYNN